MDSREQHRVYRMVKIERGIEAVPIEGFEFEEYADAWNFCIHCFVKDNRISGFFIYSTRGTGIYLKRSGIGVAESIEKKRLKILDNVLKELKKDPE